MHERTCEQITKGTHEWINQMITKWSNEGKGLINNWKNEKRMNKWMNNQKNRRINEQISEWMNEWM